LDAYTWHVLRASNPMLSQVFSLELLGGLFRFKAATPDARNPLAVDLDRPLAVLILLG